MAPTPAPATFPATPTVVVAALPATFRGTVTTAHELSDPILMREISAIVCFFMILDYCFIALMTPDFIFFQVLVWNSATGLSATP